MEGFATFYAGMAALTALWLFIDVRPLGSREWAGLAVIAAVWPVAFAYALYAAITRGAL